MARIKCRVLSFDKVDANGIVISKDCKINYSEKVTNIIKEEDGLYFDGESEDLFKLTKKIVDQYAEDEKKTYEFIQELKEDK